MSNSSQPVILWVDNDRPYLLPYIAELEDSGYRVVTAESLVEGKRKLLSEPRLDLAILDMNLPVATTADLPLNTLEDVEHAKGGVEAGFVLGRFIREHRPDLPFVGFSLRLDDKARTWFEQHGRGYATKYALSDPTELHEFVKSRMRCSEIDTGKAQQLVVSPPPARSSPPAASDAEHLRLQLRQLELEYDLARAGMSKIQYATLSAAIFGGVMLVLAFVSNFWGKREFINGESIVIIIAIVALSLLGFSSLVFGRAATLKAQITKTKKELSIALGERIR